jgi:predicted anti-sigma-YlaC factor YlaD
MGVANARGLTCADLVELVSDYIEGALASEQRARFEEHLTICQGCVNYLDQIRTTIALTGRLRVDDLSPEVQAELVSTFGNWRTNSPG